MSEAGSWSNTPLCVSDGGQDTAAVFVLGVAGEGSYQLYRELMSGWLHWLLREPGHSPSPPLCYAIVVEVFSSKDWNSY